MIDFKPIGLEDRDTFLSFLGDYNFSTYEYSFLTLFLWRELCSVEYAIIDDALVVKKTEKDKGSYFMQPLGYSREKLGELVQKLRNISLGIPDMRTLFRDVEEPFLQELKEVFGENIKYIEDTDNFDYVYESEKLITLAGRKLHSKKNHYNQFITLYNHSIRDLCDSEVRTQCKDFIIKWCQDKIEEDEQLRCEMEGTIEVLENYKALNALGMAVYVEDKIVGFTVGEKANKDLGIIHIEKGDSDYKGVYAFINKAFAEKYLSEVTFINREEDLGLPGLRKAKVSYQPFKLEKKYIVEIG